jgi:hypothetical protein
MPKVTHALTLYMYHLGVGIHPQITDINVFYGRSLWKHFNGVYGWYVVCSYQCPKKKNSNVMYTFLLKKKKLCNKLNAKILKSL